MGNGTSSPKSTLIGDCLLNQNELKKLDVDGCFDYRDKNGRFYAVDILKKNKSSLYIHYQGRNKKHINKWVDYKNNPLSFAKFKSVTSRKPKRLTNIRLYGFVQVNPRPNDTNSKWRKGKVIEKDHVSGQVKVEFRDRSNKLKVMWTHLDNKYEIKSNNNTQQRPSQQRSSQHRSSQHRGHNGYGQQQSQQREQIQEQDQMTVRTQLLLDDTKSLISMTREYLNHFNLADCNKKELSLYNQKVVGSLTLFKMKVDAMRSNAKKQGLDFNDAFKSSSMLIKQFEISYKKEFGKNQLLMQRLNPCLNYMRAILCDKNNVAPLPYLNEYKFNKKIASEVMSGVQYATNHVMPKRIKEINKNNNKYKLNQKNLKQQYEDEQHVENVHDVNFNNLVQDFSSNNIAFGKSKKEQDEMNRRESQQYAHQDPDLQNDDAMAMDEDNDDE
jgi:hypothetical protein